VKRKILFWFGLIVSVVFLYIALRDIEFAEFVSTLRQAKPGPMIAAFVLITGLYTIRALRWHTIIRARYRVPYFTAFRIEMIGLFSNNVLPARAGEIVRAFFLRREANVTKSFAFGTILVDRVTDLAILLALMLVALSQLPDSSIMATVNSVEEFAFIALSGLILGMIVLVLFRTRFVALLEKLFGCVLSKENACKLAGKFDDFSRGLEVLRNPIRLAAVLLMALTIWGGMTVGYYLIFLGLGFEVPFSAAITTIALVNLGLLVPSSPGYVGTYEFFVLKSLEIYGVSAGAAIAFALISRMFWYLVEICVGFVMLLTSHVKIGQLVEVSQSDEDAADPDSPTRSVQPASEA
jgi:uncharacterized protein (TIRG00374 family)